MRFYGTMVIMIFFLSSTIAQNIPIDFEDAGNGADWTWTTFENDTDPVLEIVANPDPMGINTSSTVAKFTALETGQPFAGCESMHGAGIGSFTIDAENAIVRIMVWKSVISDVGIKLVRADDWSLGEIKVANTLTNEWEQLEFDFTAHIGNNYDQIVVFPDFNDRQTDQIIYFDNVYGEAVGTTSTSDPERKEIKIFPNPVVNVISINAHDEINYFKIFSMSGEVVHNGRDLNGSTIDVTKLQTGIYFLEVSIGQSVSTHKFIKE